MTLLSVIINASIGMIVCACATQQIFAIVQAYYTAQKIIDVQQSKAILRYFITTDARNAQIHIASCNSTNYDCIGEMLILTKQRERIIYSLRESVLSSKQQKKYAIYREELLHNAQALIEGITGWEPRQMIVHFLIGKPLEILCTHQST